MPDELPTGNKAMYVFLEMVALAFAFSAVETFIGNKPLYIWAGCLVLAILFFLTGIKWPQIKSAIGARFPFIVLLALFILLFLGGIRWPEMRLSLAMLFIGSVCAYLVLGIRSLRRDFEIYVMPRNITSKQAEDLRECLSRREAHSVTVKVNPLDQEALEYASQLFRALKRTDWDTTISTSNGEPHTLNCGLHILVIGSNSGPPDRKHDPEPLLRETLTASHIEVNGSGSVGAGNYALFLLVGHRPLKLSSREPLLRRFGRWLGTVRW